MSREAPGREAATTSAPEVTDRREAWLLAAALAAIYLLLVAAPLVRGVPQAIGGVIVTVLFTGAVLAAAALGARLRISALAETLGMVDGVAVWLVLLMLAGRGPLLRLLLGPASAAALILACVLGGRLLSRLLRERNILLPIAIVLAVADIFTVFMGPVGAVLARAPEFVSRVSVGLPTVGSAAGPEGAAGLTHFATLGPGDTVFAALLLTCVVRFGLSLRLNYAWMAALVAGFLALVVALPAFPPMPVLPLVAVAFLIANRGQFHLSSEERRNMIVAFVFLIALFAGLGMLTRSLAERIPPSAPETTEPAAQSQSAEPGSTSP